MKNLKLEPVRVIGWVMTAVVLVGSVVTQVWTNYNKDTGWVGLAFSVMMALGTELQRSKVTPVAKNPLYVPPSSEAPK